MKKKKGYWYLYYHAYCPVCGREDTVKIKQSSKKPKKYEHRHIWLLDYDYCDVDIY